MHSFAYLPRRVSGSCSGGKAGSEGPAKGQQSGGGVPPADGSSGKGPTWASKTPKNPRSANGFDPPPPKKKSFSVQSSLRQTAI